MLAVLKPILFWVHQVDLAVPLPEWLHTTFVCYGNSSITFRAGDTDFTAFEADYIVLSPAGEIKILNPAQFHRHYSIVNPSGAPE